MSVELALTLPQFEAEVFNIEEFRPKIVEAEQESYIFADERVEVFPIEGVVRVEEDTRRIQPKPLAVLTVIARRAGLHVSDRLISTEVWGSYDKAMDQHRVPGTMRLAQIFLGPELGHRKTGAIRRFHGGYTALEHMPASVT